MRDEVGGGAVAVGGEPLVALGLLALDPAAHVILAVLTRDQNPRRAVVVAGADD
jgi:hypothetical protein